MNHRFQLVDVFADRPYSGNPLAVVFDADNLATEAMQQIARWLNLSETAFLVSPSRLDADYRVRIFTLDREMPFAGHPTLGSCHAWLSDGGQPRDESEVIQECGAGLISIRRSDTTLDGTAEHGVHAAPTMIRTIDVSTKHTAEIRRRECGDIVCTPSSTVAV